MSRGNELFMQSGYMPGLFETSLPVNNNPLGGNTPGDLTGMLISMGIQSIFGGPGKMPGQFFPTQNIADQIRNQQWSYGSFQAMNAAAGVDQNRMEATFRGAAQMMGINYGPEQMRAGATMARDFNMMMPFIAPMAPLTMDAMFGASGSAQVAAMNVWQRSRHEIDPTTGLYGMSPDVAGRRSEDMYRNIYESSDVAGAGLSSMRGMGIGAATSVWGELGRRGMLGQSIGRMSQEDQVQELKLQNLVGGIPGVMGALGTKGTADFLDSAEGRKLKEKHDSRQSSEAVKNMIGAVSAIKDLFGEQGQADAPMQVLFQKLNDLTSGGLAMQSPDRLESNVRKTQALLRMGGISLDSYSSLIAGGNQMAANMGVNPAFAPEIAMNAAAMGMAYSNVTGMASPAWGRLNREQFVQKDMQLQASALAAGTTNQLSALARYQKEVGGLTGEAGAIANAVINNDQAYFDKHRDMALDNKLVSVFGDAVGGATANRYFRQYSANEEYTNQFRTNDFTRTYLQGAEVAQGMRFSMGRILGTVLQGEQKGKAAYAVTDALANAKLDVVNTAEGRNRVISDALVNSVGMGREQARQLAPQIYGEWGVYAKEEMNLTGQSGLQMFNKDAMTDRQRSMRQVKYESDLDQILSPLNRALPLARLVDVMKGGTQDPMEALARTLGVTGANLTADTNKMLSAGADATGRNVTDRLALGDTRARLAVATEGSKAVMQLRADAYAHGQDVSEYNAQLRALTTGEGSYDAIVAMQKKYGLQDETKLINAIGLSDENAKRTFGANGVLVRNMIRGLITQVDPKTGGMVGLTEASGVSTQSMVGKEDMKTLFSQIETASKISSDHRIDPKTGKWMEKDKLRVGKLASKAVDEVLRITSAALSDEATFKAAGGNTDQVDAPRKKAMELDALVAASGKSREELLSSEDTNDPNVMQARKLWAGMTDDARKLNANLNMPPTELSPEEKKKFTKRQDEIKKDPDKWAKETVDKTLSKLGVTVDEKQRQLLEDKAKKSSNPELLALELERAAEATKTLSSPLSDEERKRVEATAGAIGEVDDPLSGNTKAVGKDASTVTTSVGKFIDEATKKEQQADQDKKTLIFKFADGQSIKIEDGRAHMGGLEGSAQGSVPAPG